MPGPASPEVDPAPGDEPPAAADAAADADADADNERESRPEVSDPAPPGGDTRARAAPRGKTATAQKARGRRTSKASAAPSTTPEGTPPAGPPGRFVAGAAALGLVLVVVLVVGVIFAVQQLRASQRQASDTAAMDVARDVTTRLGSLSADNLKAQVDGLLEQSTGQFRQQVTGTGALLQSVIGGARFQSRAEVTATGLESNDGTRAVVLVTSRSQITNAQVPQGTERRYKQIVTLQWDGNRWLANNVENPV